MAAQLCWRGAVCALMTLSLRAAESSPTSQQWQSLQEQVQKQQRLIEELSRKISELEKDRPAAAAETPEPAKPRTGFSLGKINFGVEGGLAIFRSEARGNFPNAEFRVDEAKLFVEAPIWKEVYFFTELNITTREDSNIYLQPGELYVDFENVSRLWDKEGQLNLRIGRMDIPFGEEYLTRNAIDNPLISHSVSDIWGIDEGIEIYGAVAGVQYVVAVQNGSHPALNDHNVDKSVAARLGYKPARWLQLSASAMRTGAIGVTGDKFSELWFGNDFLRNHGSPDTTRFEANVVEGDVRVRWANGHLGASGGYLKYDDDDPFANNQREVYYYYVEGVQHITSKLYAAARWSQMLAEGGFPMVGDGDSKKYSLNTLTETLWRLGLGAGYRFSPNLLLKAEYTLNGGEELGGVERRHENIVAGEVAFRF
jgi:hypothetical protein